MPTKQGGRALKNASTSDRCSFRRNTAFPAASTPCSWKTRLAMSKPTAEIFMVDGSFSLLHLTARAWHIDAVRGRPPHQICTTKHPCAAAGQRLYSEPHRLADLIYPGLFGKRCLSPPNSTQGWALSQKISIPGLTQ